VRKDGRRKEEGRRVDEVVADEVFDEVFDVGDCVGVSVSVRGLCCENGPCVRACVSKNRRLTTVCLPLFLQYLLVFLLFLFLYLGLFSSCTAVTEI
jgi:hypothetical protein